MLSPRRLPPGRRLDEICREANITPGGLYHYFGSKEELIAAVIDRSAQTAVERDAHFDLHLAER